MATTNKHGLSRTIPAEIKRQLRQEAGFGCVVCGVAICHYEHIDPEFSDATEHDPDAMAFLCGGCHDKVTRGHLSKASVSRAKLNPKAKQMGFAFEAFDVGENSPKIHFGPLSAVNFKWAIRVNERPVLWIEKPEEKGAPFRINAQIRDSNGKIVLSIINNEWRVNSLNWDVEVKGTTITFRTFSRTIALQIRTSPPNDLFVERMNMTIEGYHMRCDGEKFVIAQKSGHSIAAYSMDFDGCTAAIDLLRDGSMLFGSGGGSISRIRFAGIDPSSIINLVSQKRNERCNCGSGRRFKHCCGKF